MSKQKWDEGSALDCLGRNRVRVQGRKIAAFNHGIKIQGAVDYLVGTRGYYRVATDSIKGK